MLRIAGQTAVPIGMTFFVDTYGRPGGFYFYLTNFFDSFFPRATPGPSASYK